MSDSPAYGSASTASASSSGSGNRASGSRPPGPKWVAACIASSTSSGLAPSITVAIREQQMSAECMPGRIAFRAATTPPTGIVPTLPDGHASGMIAARSTTGTRSTTSIVSRSLATFSRSSKVSAVMFHSHGAGSARWGSSGGGRCASITPATSSGAWGRALTAASIRPSAGPDAAPMAIRSAPLQPVRAAPPPVAPPSAPSLVPSLVPSSATPPDARPVTAPPPRGRRRCPRASSGSSTGPSTACRRPTAPAAAP